jgi:hypothetical protein
MNTLLLLAAPAAANLQSAFPLAEPPATIFDRYADSIIGCFSCHYDAFEVHGVRDFASGTDEGTGYEIDNLTPTSFSVYAHLKDGGLDCVGDFGKYEDAVQYGRSECGVWVACTESRARPAPHDKPGKAAITACPLTPCQRVMRPFLDRLQ